MSQNMGAQWPTNRARRSAFPRSSSLTVLARIHRPMHSPMDPIDAARKGPPLKPVRRIRFSSMRTA